MRGASGAKFDSQSLGVEPRAVKNARSSRPGAVRPDSVRRPTVCDHRRQWVRTMSASRRSGRWTGIKLCEGREDVGNSRRQLRPARVAVRARSVTWVRRSQVPPFSPAPGIQIQPVIGESLMTCWIAMEPGAIVAEHSHVNEQLGVVVEGSVSITAAGETREMAVGDAYVVPSDLAHNGVAGRGRGRCWSRHSCRSARSTPRPGEPSPTDKRPRRVACRAAVWHNPGLVR